jgi:DNA primase catalytic core
VAPEGDHFRTRLTHTLEVTQISRTVARALRLNEDLTEAIGLGHDLGHPAFGHIGEDVLDDCLRGRFGTGFRHYEHSLRVVDVLELDGAGLNLCDDVRDGIARHSGRAPMPRTLEGRIVRLVDRVAYINHDIDDALRAGVLHADELPAEPIAVLGDTGSRRIDALVHDLVEHSEVAGDIVQGERSAARWTACGPSCSTTSTSGRSRGASTPRSTASSHAVRVLRRRARPDPRRRRLAGRRPGPARHRLAGGMTDRYCIRAFEALSVPRRSRSRLGRSGALHRRVPRPGRDAVDMVDLVGSRVELRRAGVNRFEGLCPFHDERTPSFGINPAEKLYYCFGCGEGGDAFKFVQETEGVGFAGALEYLADRYGVALEVVEEDPAAAQRRAERERLLELLERTAAFYVRYLWDSEEAAHAREYLAGRGLQEGALREFRVGYAPSAVGQGARRLAPRRVQRPRARRVRARVALAEGGRTYDRFRRRIMFPLCDQRGRVLGFGARAMGADQKPKYLNSSDGLVFHKGRHLFGADIARTPAAKAAEVIVAEGYTDVIAMHQAGLRNTVGLMGTALTDEQVGELARLAPTVLLALDADAAGQEAMLRGARVARGAT